MILAMLVGIPARVVSGWAITVGSESQFICSDQAHQWAEVAFEALGWVSFEPTAAGGATDRAAATAEFEVSVTDESDPDDDTLAALNSFIRQSERPPYSLSGFDSVGTEALAVHGSPALRASWSASIGWTALQGSQRQGI